MDFKFLCALLLDLMLKKRKKSNFEVGEELVIANWS